MKKIIIGMLIVMMLLIPTINAFGLNKINEYDEKILATNNDENIEIRIYKAPVFFGVNFDIKNNGESTINSVNWSFRTKAAITGTGIFIKEKIRTGNINQINPDQTITIKFRPFSFDTKSPFGLGNLYINASAESNGMNIRTQQRAFLLGFKIIIYIDTYQDIKPDEAYERYLNNEFDLIIDVVGLDIYSLGHLPGAVNYIWADGTLNSKISELDPTLTYLVYCHTDPPSTASAQALVNAGFENVYRLEGNFASWKNSGYPIET